MEKRRTRRVAVNGSALLMAGRVGNGATLLNLSEGGCGLELSWLMPPDARVALHLVISEDQPPMFINEARVCWSTAGRIGTEFLALSDETRQQLREWLRSRHGP